MRKAVLLYCDKPRKDKTKEVLITYFLLLRWWVVSLSENIQKMEELLKRIDQLIDILNIISRDLSKVSTSLKSIGASTTVSRVESGQTLFPKELREMLDFEETEKHIIIKPRGYLGSENFAKIASIVREAGGEYISAGKESHFRISKETLE